MHLWSELDLCKPKAYTAGFVRCAVKTKPVSMEGGHVFFEVEQSGAAMLAAVYEPTGIASIAAKLEPGDEIEIGAGVRKGTTKHPKVLNVEYLSVIALATVYDVKNPLCKMCGRRMKSEGYNKGYQCDSCKFRDPHARKMMIPRKRLLKTGRYIPTPKAHRHLTKPVQRYGLEKIAGGGFSGFVSY